MQKRIKKGAEINNAPFNLYPVVASLTPGHPKHGKALLPQRPDLKSAISLKVSGFGWLASRCKASCIQRYGSW